MEPVENMPPPLRVVKNTMSPRTVKFSVPPLLGWGKKMVSWNAW
jgi:hypothetical protein